MSVTCLYQFLWLIFQGEECILGKVFKMSTVFEPTWIQCLEMLQFMARPLGWFIIIIILLWLSWLLMLLLLWVTTLLESNHNYHLIVNHQNYVRRKRLQSSVVVFEKRKSYIIAWKCRLMIQLLMGLEICLPKKRRS